MELLKVKVVFGGAEAEDTVLMPFELDPTRRRIDEAVEDVFETLRMGVVPADGDEVLVVVVVPSGDDPRRECNDETCDNVPDLE